MRALLRRGARITARDALPAIAAVIAMATFLSLFGRYSWLLDLLTFGRQHLAATSVLLLLAALCARRRRLALIAIACVVVNGTPLLISPNASVGHATAAVPAMPVRIMSLNLFASNPRRNPTLDSLREADADIVALQETGPRWFRRLGALADRYPYSFPARGGRPNSNAILSRYPIVEGDSSKFACS